MLLKRSLNYVFPMNLYLKLIAFVIQRRLVASYFVGETLNYKWQGIFIK